MEETLEDSSVELRHRGMRMAKYIRETNSFESGAERIELADGTTVLAVSLSRLFPIAEEDDGDPTIPMERPPIEQ